MRLELSGRWRRDRLGLQPVESRTADSRTADRAWLAWDEERPAARKRVWSAATQHRAWAGATISSVSCDKVFMKINAGGRSRAADLRSVGGALLARRIGPASARCLQCCPVLPSVERLRNAPA